jgi:DNA replication protein DnaC
MIPDNKLNRILDKIKQNCSCSGEGCSICLSQVGRVQRYAKADIPIDYWLLAFKDFQGDKNFKNLIKTKLADIDSVYDEGKSLAFVGNLGVGKTFAACSLLKMAIIKDYTAQYTTMSYIINNILSNDISTASYLKQLNEIDFLAIDEFDERYVFPSEKTEILFGSNLEYILRTRFQNKLPTILCSNTEDIDSVLSSEFSRAFKSLRSKYMDVVYVSGKDFRKEGAR